MTTPRFDLRTYGHHAIFKAMGFTAEELSLPRIAVINSWSEQSPTHTEKSYQELVSDQERDNLLFIDQGYDSEERVLKLAKKMKREW